MNQFLTFAFIGGDLRQIQTISLFAKDDHPIKTYGLDTAEFQKHLPIQKCADLDDCLHGADVVVLPLPYQSGQGRIHTAFSDREIYIGDILRKMKSEQLLLAGRVDVQLTAPAELYHIRVIDYAKQEELAIRNSIPTAEGALEIAMAETPYTIHQSRALVLGYGRIGKVLAQSLQSLGAKVSVAARKQSDVTWIAYRGYRPIPFTSLQDNLGEFDLIFNTVPTMVLDFKRLSQVSSHCLIIDLASRPGGVDFETAQKLNRRVIWALSLPGKVAPQTAGDIIKDTIVHILEELGV